MIPKPQRHPFEPLYDENSRILILGSFPSVKSREMLLRSSSEQILASNGGGS